VLSPGWEHSTGCRLERAFFEALGRPVLSLDDFHDDSSFICPYCLKMQPVPPRARDAGVVFEVYCPCGARFTRAAGVAPVSWPSHLDEAMASRSPVLARVTLGEFVAREIARSGPFVAGYPENDAVLLSFQDQVELLPDWARLLAGADGGDGNDPGAPGDAAIDAFERDHPELRCFPRVEKTCENCIHGPFEPLEAIPDPAITAAMNGDCACCKHEFAPLPSAVVPPRDPGGDTWPFGEPAPPGAINIPWSATVPPPPGVELMRQFFLAVHGTLLRLYREMRDSWERGDDKNPFCAPTPCAGCLLDPSICRLVRRARWTWYNDEHVEWSELEKIPRCAEIAVALHEHVIRRLGLKVRKHARSMLALARPPAPADPICKFEHYNQLVADAGLAGFGSVERDPVEKHGDHVITMTLKSGTPEYASFLEMLERAVEEEELHHPVAGRSMPLEITDRVDLIADRGDFRRCEECDGTGYIDKVMPSGAGYIDFCPLCNGWGRVPSRLLYSYSTSPLPIPGAIFVNYKGARFPLGEYDHHAGKIYTCCPACDAPLAPLSFEFGVICPSCKRKVH